MKWVFCLYLLVGLVPSLLWANEPSQAICGAEALEAISESLENMNNEPGVPLAVSGEPSQLVYSGAMEESIIEIHHIRRTDTDEEFQVRMRSVQGNCELTEITVPAKEDQ